MVNKMKQLVLVFIVVGTTTLGFSQEREIVYTFFANVANEQFRGPLIGIVNVGQGDRKGLQFFGINVNTGNFGGLQLGGLNVAPSVGGAQIAGINITYKEMKGTQIGGINIARHSINGVQFGFINFVDSAVNCIPMGFLFSIVRHGGYRAIEYSFSEFYPVNIAYKFGVEKFYNTVFLSYNPFEQFSGVGYGFGSILPYPINASFFFNPECNSFVSLGKKSNIITSIVPYFGYSFTKKMSVIIGPSVTWQALNKFRETPQSPFFYITNNEIDEKNSIVVGARVGFRYRFNQ